MIRPLLIALYILGGVANWHATAESGRSIPWRAHKAAFWPVGLTLFAGAVSGALSVRWER